MENLKTIESTHIERCQTKLLRPGNQDYDLQINPSYLYNQSLSLSSFTPEDDGSDQI